VNTLEQHEEPVDMQDVQNDEEGSKVPISVKLLSMIQINMEAWIINNLGEYIDSCMEPRQCHSNSWYNWCVYEGSFSEASNEACEDVCPVVEEHND